MKKRSLIRQVYPAYLLLVMVAVIGMTWYATRAIRAFHHTRTEEELTSAARLAAAHLRTLIPTVADGEMDATGIDALCKTLGRTSGYRVTLVLPSGNVAGDSEETPATMDNHADRPEIRDAMAQGVGISTRYSHTLGKRMMYVAVPAVFDGRTAGVVRVSLGLTAVDRTLVVLWHRMAVAGVITGCLVVLISLFISRRIRRPLDEIRRRAEAIGQGNLSERVSSSDMLEIDVLATTINHMADELNERISMITQQRDEENALLACMMESVIAVDVEKRVLKMNQSAQVLFGVNASVCGKNVMEIIRNNDLRDIIARALASSEPVEGSVSLPDDGRYLLAHGTTLKGVAGQRIGALVVLNDVTRLHRLEMMRRDFVADVSHELKTPITSIKGFVETLLDEGGKDSEQTKGFLRIVAKQTDRLMAIIEDLLMLSRLEQEDYRRDLPLEEALLKDVVESAIEVCRHKAREKQIEVKPSCASGLRARINAALFEQAIVNLVDNAIKYSPSGSVVRVDTKEDGGEVVLQVRDNGSGIEKEHLPRLFERFYRVDKGRSRQLGGTGLGLAIVKHIVLAHHGRVDVESVLGKGSVFTIVLPQV